jgi:RHS repeat-associated protein
MQALVANPRPAGVARAQVDRSLAVVEAVNTAAPIVYYVHVDHLHRPVKMTSAAKATVWDAVWQPFSGAHAITGTASLNLRFPGQWFQAESGLHFNWHRSYDPTLGKYAQPDPVGFVVVEFEGSRGWRAPLERRAGGRMFREYTRTDASTNKWRSCSICSDLHCYS